MQTQNQKTIGIRESFSREPYFGEARITGYVCQIEDNGLRFEIFKQKKDAMSYAKPLRNIGFVWAWTCRDHTLVDNM